LTWPSVSEATEYFITETTTGKKATVINSEYKFEGQPGKNYTFNVLARSTFGSSDVFAKLCSIPSSGSTATATTQKDTNFTVQNKGPSRFGNAPPGEQN